MLVDDARARYDATLAARDADNVAAAEKATGFDAVRDFIGGLIGIIDG